jgi:hypothetical protein
MRRRIKTKRLHLRHKPGNVAVGHHASGMPQKSVFD